MKKALVIGIIMTVMLLLCKQKKVQTTVVADSNAEWISLFNGENLDGWFVRGEAKWDVRDSILTGIDGMGHIYAEPVLTDLEVKGVFRVSEGGNSGLYFRCNPPKNNPDGFPRGYEAQIDNHAEAYTGWLWKPGKPTGKAKDLLTQDNEWFSLRLRAVGNFFQIWVNDQLVTEYHDSEYKKGHFAIQGHNEGMMIEAKELYYRDLSQRGSE